jgi:putative SOS response-associated peptidase YedK
MEAAMCTSYKGGRDIDLKAIFDVDPPTGEWRDEIYKDYAAPIILAGEGGKRAELATFGIVPRKHIPPGVKVFDTMNARAESVGEKRSFSGAWKKQQLCLTPR